MSKWEMVRLGDVCDLNPPKKELSLIDQKLEVSFVPMADLQAQQINFEPKEIKQLHAVIKGYTYFSNNDVLLAKITPCFENGKSGVARKLKNGIGFGSTEFIVLRPNQRVLSEWIYYCISNRNFFIAGKKSMTGSAGQQRISTDFIKIHKIPLPPLEVQEQIAQTLDAASELITLRKKQLAELDNLIKSTFYDMFGDPVMNEKGWEVNKLGDLLDSIRYGTSTPPVFSEKGAMFIRATNIKRGRIVKDDMKYISEIEAKKISKCKVRGGEIIIVRSGINTGDTCIITTEYINQFAGYDLIIELNRKMLNPTFVNELINTSYMSFVIKPLTRRAAQPHINSDQVKSLRIPLPPLALQNQFAEIVTKIEEQKALVQKAIDESQYLFDSLMSEYFE